MTPLLVMNFLASWTPIRETTKFVCMRQISFVIERGFYCYRRMPFGLKNASATYQRLVNKIFEDQIGKNMEVYMDDMLVKSIKANNHVDDLEKAFSILQRYKMKLNPTKCAFGVSSGKFLGFIISQRGIEANLEKIKIIQESVPLRNINEVQKLTRRLAALGRFLSKSAERCLPFFKMLRNLKFF